MVNKSKVAQLRKLAGQGIPQLALIIDIEQRAQALSACSDTFLHALDSGDNDAIKEARKNLVQAMRLVDTWEEDLKQARIADGLDPITGE